MTRRRPGPFPSLRSVLRLPAWRSGLAVLAGLLTLAGVAPPAGADASGPVPPRRVVAETGTDFYGGDIRSIYGTSLELCRNICLDTADCGAFTFNLKANACFLKSGVTDRAPFANALSGAVVATDPGTLAVAVARAEDLAFLPAMYLDAARAAALDGPAYPANGHHPFILPMSGKLLSSITVGTRFSVGVCGSRVSTSAGPGSSSMSKFCPASSRWWPPGCSMHRPARAWTSAYRTCRSQRLWISMTF